MKKILLFEDDEFSVLYAKAILNDAGYDVAHYDESKSVEDFVVDYKPDLILLDVEMPHLNGFEVCKRIKKIKEFKNVPVIFVTGRSEEEDVVAGFKYGAVDYIRKPYGKEELKIRIKTHLKIAGFAKKMSDSNKKLERKVTKQMKMIADAQMGTIFSLAKLAQSRDDDTGDHLVRVEKYCYLMSKKMSKMSKYKKIIDEDFIKNIVNASSLHDIGKVGISDLILLKPGKLTPEEFEKMKAHTVIGYETLAEVDKKFGGNSFINMGKIITRSHHERWDGNGYPDKLKSEEIPLAARIMSIADVYDALATKRVYKDAFPVEKCVQIIKEGKGTQFDPNLVDVFVALADDFAKVHAEFE